MKKLPKIINQEEFEKIFKVVLNSKHKKKKHFALAMLLGFEAGMRISEILGYDGKKNTIIALQKSQIESASIRILQGKGQKDRIVPRPKRMNETAINLLPLKIKRRTMQRYITQLGRSVLNKEITFHTLRHGFGSHLAQTRPLHEIQMLMGHSRLDTTGIYLHANPKQAIDGARDVFWVPVK